MKLKKTAKVAGQPYPIVKFAMPVSNLHPEMAGYFTIEQAESASAKEIDDIPFQLQQKVRPQH